MSADIRVYREGYDTIFPADTPDPDSSLHGLIRNYVELYVDTGKPELVGYLPSQTTVLDLRRENLFYHYRPGDPTALAEEFGDFLELLHEPDISGGGEDRTALARREGVPESIVETGVFEEGWSLDKSEPSTQVAFDFANAEPAFPGLSRLQREVVLDLLGEQRLVLGIEDFAAGLSAIQYLLGADEDIRVAIATREDARALSTLDLVLVPGADRNFEPLDSESASALNERTGQKIDNWTAELKSDASAAIDDLVGELDRSNYAIYRGLGELESYLNDGESVDIEADAAEEIIAIKEEVETSEHLTVADRSEVIQAIGDRVRRAKETVADRIRDEKLPAVEDAIEAISEDVENPFEAYDQLKTAEEIVAVDYETELPDRGSLHPKLEPLRDLWIELLTETDSGDPFRRRIRTEVVETIDAEKDGLEDKLTSRAIRTLDTELERLGAKYKRKPDQFLQEAHAIGRAFGGQETGGLPDETEQELGHIIDVVTDDAYNEELRRELRSRLESKLSGELLDAYTESVKSLFDLFYDQSSDPNTGLGQLREVIKTGRLEGQSPTNRVIRDAIEYIQDAYRDDYLQQHDKDVFRNEIEGLVDEYAAKQKDDYERRLMSVIDNIDMDREMYENITGAIKNNGHVGKDVPFEVGRFAEIWREMLGDNALSSNQKIKLKRDIKMRIDKPQTSPRKPVSAEPKSTNQSEFPWWITIGSFRIPTVVLVLAVVVLGITLGYLMASTLPFLGSSLQPGLSLGTSLQEGTIDGYHADGIESSAGAAGIVTESQKSTDGQSKSARPDRTRQVIAFMYRTLD